MNHRISKPLGLALGLALALTGLAAQASVFQAAPEGYVQIAADSSNADKAKTGSKPATRSETSSKRPDGKTLPSNGN